MELVGLGVDGQGETEKPVQEGGDDDFNHQGGDNDTRDQGREVMDGGDEEDQLVTYHCVQGSRQGRHAPDILWIGKNDKERSFIWQGKRIHDIYLRYLDEGLLTVLVRCMMNVAMKVIINWLVDYLSSKLKMEDAFQAFEAGKLEVTFKGGRVNREHLVSSFPDHSMFLLCRGALPQEFKGHAGRVWQCSVCKRSDNKRTNAIRKKCTSKNGKHKCYFDDNQFDKLGDHGATEAGKPLYLPRDSQTAIASPRQVSAYF